MVYLGTSEDYIQSSLRKTTPLVPTLVGTTVFIWLWLNFKFTFFFAYRKHVPIYLIDFNLVFIPFDHALIYYMYLVHQIINEVL